MIIAMKIYGNCIALYEQLYTVKDGSNYIEVDPKSNRNLVPFLTLSQLTDKYPDSTGQRLLDNIPAKYLSITQLNSLSNQDLQSIAPNLSSSQLDALNQNKLKELIKNVSIH